MSTTLIDMKQGEGFQLARFAGGITRGVCYQITMPGGDYVQLTKQQMHTLALAFVADSMLGDIAHAQV